MKNILLTGGAGYIGSLATKRLLDIGYDVTVLDSLEKGNKKFVDKRAKFYKIDITDYKKLEKTLFNKKFDIILHFAGLKDAGASMIYPEIYQDNITGTLNLIKLSQKLGVNKIIFSSSAAVYGEPQSKIITEEHVCNPTSFYGYTKLASEQLLEWNRRLNKIDFIALRYFNVAGDGGLEYIDYEGKNVFNAILKVLNNKEKYLSIFGNDYNTPDGTGIRDYIHISDLVDAHIKAININGSHIINLGSEKGYSVLEVIKKFEQIINKKIPYKITKKRKGDVAVSIASSKKAEKILNWKPKLGLNEMVKSTLKAYKLIK